jgi:cathepsin B
MSISLTTSSALLVLLARATMSVVLFQTSSSPIPKGIDEFNKFNELAKKIKNMKTTWQARVRPSFDYDSNRIQALASLIINEEEFIGMASIGPLDFVRNDFGTFPVNFTAAEKWPECADSINDVMDQGYCGSCWAVAPASALTDRICISSKGVDKRRLSEQDMLECCTSCGLGCRGGSVVNAHNYAMATGMSTGGAYMSVGNCKPYSFAPCSDVLWRTQAVCFMRNTTLTCRNNCQASYEMAYPQDKIKVKAAYRVL